MITNILIAEDDGVLYDSMVFMLQHLATQSDVHIELHHAVTRNEALALMQEKSFNVISTDMGMPLMHGAPIDRFAGASLCSNAILRVRRYRPWKHLMVFSGQEVARVDTELARQGLSKDTPRYPEIFEKDSAQAWAKAVIAKCIN